MRWAKSYSIIDHEILHGGYLHRLSHNSLILYFFLVVVGDREGKSFYGDNTIGQILRLSGSDIDKARLELISEGLIDYRRPNFWVKNINQGENRKWTKSQDCCERNEIKLSSDPSPLQTPEAIKNVIEQFLRKVGE